jgi:hypothetical protein
MILEIPSTADSNRYLQLHTVRLSVTLMLVHGVVCKSRTLILCVARYSENGAAMKLGDLQPIEASNS